MKKEKLSVYVIFSENILEKQANRSLNRYIFFLFPIKRGYNAMPQKIDYVELTFQNSKFKIHNYQCVTLSGFPPHHSSIIQGFTPLPGG